MRQPVTVAAIFNGVASTPINGTPVSDDRFPFKPARSVQYFSSTQVERCTKVTDDRLDYVIDMLRWLEPEETIVAATSFTDNDDVTLSQLEFSPSRVSVWVEGGTDAQRHLIDVTMQTSLGKVVTCLFILVTRAHPVVPVEFITFGQLKPDLQYPRRQWRQLNYRGFTQLDKHVQDVNETLDYYLDLADVINPAGSIDTMTIWSDDPLAMIFYVYYSGSRMVAWIGGGTSGRRSLVEIQVRTTYGEEISFCFVLELRNELAEGAMVHGNRIMPDELSVRKDRTIPYAGSLVVPRWRKLSKEVLDYTIDLSKWLDFNQRIDDVRGHVTTEGMSLLKIDFTDTNVVVWINGGENLGEFVVFLEVTINMLTQAVIRMMVRTTGMSGDEALITIEDTTVKVAQVAPLVPQPPEPVPVAKVTVEPSTLTFPTTAINTQSPEQHLTVTNTGTITAFLRSMHIDPPFRYIIQPKLRMQPGESFSVSVRYLPVEVGTNNGSLQFDFGQGLTDMVSLTGTGQVSAPVASWSNSSMDFGSVESGASSEPQNITLTNTGTAPMAITSITASGDFTITSVVPETLAVGASLTVTLRFNPSNTGQRTGTLTLVAAGAGGTKNIPLSGTGIEVSILQRLSTSGNQFVTPSGIPVRLRSVNWFGMETENYTPHGTWGRSWRGIIDQIKGMGFNCIRIPFSGQSTGAGVTPPSTAIDAFSNPDLVGLTSMEILDKYVAYAMEKGIYIVLDHHRRTAGAGTQGSPIDDSYTLLDWKVSWTIMANRYKDAVNIVGADVHNEPHDLTWDVWAGYAEECGNAIHATAPNWIIFVEGVGSYNGDSYWWGGSLNGVADRPVQLLASNRLAYSPHEYGQSVGVQTWLAYDGQPLPAGWPGNLYGVWSPHWGFIFEQNIAPIWIGEFGGKYGVNGTGEVDPVNAHHGAYEKVWTQNLMAYINGDFTGDGGNDLPMGKLGMSFSYWCFNPNSGDTGGLVQDDFITPQTTKLQLLTPLLGG